jgi:hypothetical protein
MKKTALLLTLALAVTFGALHTAQAIGGTEVISDGSFDPVTGQYTQSGGISLPMNGNKWTPPINDSGFTLIYDQQCRYDKDNKCHPRGGQVLLDRICTSGTAEGSQCGLVVDLGDGGAGSGQCTPTNICSGSAVVNSCTGQVVQQCSSQCVAGGCGSGAGGGGGGGGTGTTTGTGTGTGNMCTAGPICSGIDLHYRNSDCSETLLQQCAYGCATSACVIPSQSPTAPGISFLANPPLVRKGATCELQFSARNISKCTLTGTGINATYTATNGTLGTTTATTPGLINTTSYLLSCTGQQGNIQKSVDCKVTPTFQEF